MVDSPVSYQVNHTVHHRRLHSTALVGTQGQSGGERIGQLVYSVLSEQPVDLGWEELGLDKAHRVDVKAETISGN